MLAILHARQPFGGPSAIVTASTPTASKVTGLNHTAYRLAVYASQGELPHHHAKLASRRWPACPAGLATRKGPQYKVSALRAHRVTPCPSFVAHYDLFRFLRRPRGGKTRPIGGASRHRRLAVLHIDAQ